DLPTALDVAGHCATRGFDLARRHARAVGRLQAEIAEGHGVAAQRQATIVALELLAVFGSLGLQHDSLLEAGSHCTLVAAAAPAAAPLGAVPGTAAPTAPPAAAATPSPCGSATARASSCAGSNTSPLKIHTLMPITP